MSLFNCLKLTVANKGPTIDFTKELVDEASIAVEAWKHSRSEGTEKVKQCVSRLLTTLETAGNPAWLSRNPEVTYKLIRSANKIADFMQPGDKVSLAQAVRLSCKAILEGQSSKKDSRKICLEGLSSTIEINKLIFALEFPIYFQASDRIQQQQIFQATPIKLVENRTSQKGLLAIQKLMLYGSSRIGEFSYEDCLEIFAFLDEYQTENEVFPKHLRSRMNSLARAAGSANPLFWLHKFLEGDFSDDLMKGGFTEEELQRISCLSAGYSAYTADSAKRQDNVRLTYFFPPSNFLNLSRAEGLTGKIFKCVSKSVLPIVLTCRQEPADELNLGLKLLSEDSTSTIGCCSQKENHQFFAVEYQHGVKKTFSLKQDAFTNFFLAFMISDLHAHYSQSSQSGKLSIRIKFILDEAVKIAQNVIDKEKGQGLRIPKLNTSSLTGPTELNKLLASYKNATAEKTRTYFEGEYWNVDENDFAMLVGCVTQVRALLAKPSVM